MIAFHKYFNNNNNITHQQYFEISCVTKATALLKMNLYDDTVLSMELLAEASTILPFTAITTTNTNTTKASVNSIY